MATLRTIESLVVDVLGRSKDIIQKGWAQGADALTKDDNETDITSRSAIKFCATAAIDKAMTAARVSGDHYDEVQELAFDHLKKAGHITGEIQSWNDTKCRTQAQVVKAFSGAVMRAAKALTAAVAKRQKDAVNAAKAKLQKKESGSDRSK